MLGGGDGCELGVGRWVHVRKGEMDGSWGEMCRLCEADNGLFCYSGRMLCW